MSIFGKKAPKSVQEICDSATSQLQETAKHHAEVIAEQERKIAEAQAKRDSSAAEQELAENAITNFKNLFFKKADAE